MADIESDEIEQEWTREQEKIEDPEMKYYELKQKDAYDMIRLLDTKVNFVLFLEMIIMILILFV